ncbi:MAG TPA: radical SAM protein [Candidatus Deferrimicrobium sp.]|nr:radical SAM protein [Candidatus Deferrimicrobium sp.]
MRNVVLINPPSDCVEDDRLEPQLGLLYIAAVLRENNIPVLLYDMTGCKTPSQVEVMMKNIPAGDIYGFTVYCTNYPYVKRCLDFIRRKKEKAFIVLGGPNPTALPGYTLKDSGCDCVIAGEGEDAFLAVVNALGNRQDVPAVVDGAGRVDIDSYPFPARDLVDLESYSRCLQGEKVISLVSSRGCKYHCAHCNSVVMGGGNKPGVRYRTPANIFEELQLLISHGYHKFRFNDDNFTGNPNLHQLLDQTGALGIGYRIFARIEDLTEDNCRRLKESGCCHISVGLETLNPDNLDILGKHPQAGLESDHLHNIKKNGMTARVYFMIGLPFDNDETVGVYFEKAGRLPFDEYSLYPLIPYPGTRVWDQPGAFGYEIVDRDFTHYIQIGKGGGTCFALKHKNFTPGKVRLWYNQVTQMMAGAGRKHVKESKVAG